MIRKYHNHILQTNPRWRGKEPQKHLKQIIQQKKKKKKKKKKNGTKSLYNILNKDCEIPSGILSWN